MSGSNGSVNVSGSTVGVISTGDDAKIFIGTQQIAGLQAGEDAKEKLKQLIEQLNAELQKVPVENKKEAEKVTVLTNSLIKQANEKEPNALLEVTADGLLNATKAIAGIIPAALGIATQIAETITGLNP